MKDASLVLFLVVFALVTPLVGCDSGSSSTSGTSTNISQQSSTSLLGSKVVINNYVVVSSRRVGRTVSEYTLRAIATNTTSTRYTNVTATLTFAPPNMTIIDNAVAFGTVIGSSDTTSVDEFVIAVDLSVKSSLNDLVWQVNGTVPATGGGGSPGQTGIFMSIDDNAKIMGESTSASHPGWIELLSFSEGSKAITGGTPGGSRTTDVGFDGVTVSKYVDSSSPPLRLALADGDIFTEVKIDIIKSCNTSIYTAYAITLTVSALSELSAAAMGGSDRLTESLSLNYSRIETMYTPVGPGCRLEAPIYSFQDAGKI